MVRKHHKPGEKLIYTNIPVSIPYSSKSLGSTDILEHRLPLSNPIQKHHAQSENGKQWKKQVVLITYITGMQHNAEFNEVEISIPITNIAQFIIHVQTVYIDN